MPSDANGVYTLPDGYLAQTGQTILASQHNPPLEDLGESMSQRIMASGAKPMSGPLKAADGSVGAPSVTFNSGQTTGIYKTANGVGVSVGGVQVGEFTAAGVKTGARLVGEIVAYTGLTAPSLWVFPYGQTLLRSAYPQLWAFAQTHIASGNQFFNNGNGTTTFGIGDLRGRVIGAIDSMGGVNANRLSPTYYGAGINTLGVGGGTESKTLTTTNLPPYTPSGSISNGAITFPNAATSATVGGSINGISLGTIGASTAITGMLQPVQGTTSFTGAAQGGASTPVSAVQPTMLVYFLLFAGD